MGLFDRDRRDSETTTPEAILHKLRQAQSIAEIREIAIAHGDDVKWYEASDEPDTRVRAIHIRNLAAVRRKEFGG